jgi:hypothetical protein
MMPKLPEPDCSAYAPQLGQVGDYWLESSVRAIQEEAYKAGMAAAVPDVDYLAQIIRMVDGKNSLGAGALAEKIIEAMAAQEVK